LITADIVQVLFNLKVGFDYVITAVEDKTKKKDSIK
jgi:hypothetical protein